MSSQTLSDCGFFVNLQPYPHALKEPDTLFLKIQYNNPSHHIYRINNWTMWKFNPILKPTIWGGTKIAALKQIEDAPANIGESWEISGVEGSESTVASGPDRGLTLAELIRRHGAKLTGERNLTRYGERFPLLIKFIDAHTDLSVQVHPDDTLAQKRGMVNGKTEMWYVLDGSDSDARLALGFKRPVTREEYPELARTGEIENVLNYCQVVPGEVYFIPAGRVHAIGAGSFVVEIQQTSDATYRIYDYRRLGSDGKPRELHVEEAIDAIDFNDTDARKSEYIDRPDIPVNVAKCPYFTANLLNIDTEVMRDYKEADTFMVIIATGGEADISCGGETMNIRRGETVLVPASATGIVIDPKGDFQALEAYIP